MKPQTIKNHDPKTVYLDWVNNYLTLEYMALDYHLPYETLRTLVETGRKEHEESTKKKWVNLSDMTIAQLAKVITNDWQKVNFAAKPYLYAMLYLETVNDSYFQDSGKSIVAYFLSNASTYRGEVAREIKKELNKRIK